MLSLFLGFFCQGFRVANPLDKWSGDGANPFLFEDPFANEYGDEMQQALARLPVELRETLLLVVVGELTHQEVADLLHIPLGTVLSRVSRARQRLRQYLLAASQS